MNHQPNFIDWLEEKFIDLDELGGIAITKDNCEDLFDGWLSQQGTEEIIEWANRYGEQMYLIGQKELVEDLKNN